ncbi:MAG: sigma-70 family RNA polymerase sigma factor [Clostridia bacterium]|nr:sigma-70 family RNA polymerase sigma factor [Clostridia bacterium]
MQKGNYGNAVQAVEESGIEQEFKNGRGYSKNIDLVRIAQGEDEELSMRATEELVILNRGLVRSVAIRFRDRGVEIEDLIQIGTIGLIKAIRSFDVGRGTLFSTYAVPMIFGEIRRALRDEGMIKVGRYYKSLGVQLARAKNELVMQYGDGVHISMIAEAVGVSVEEAAVALDAMSAPMSLSDFVYGDEDGTVLEDTIADKDSLEYNKKFFERMALREAIDKMNELWQKILVLRFFRNKTQQQVADILGLSQVKVSREEKKIVEFLRNEMR